MKTYNELPPVDKSDKAMVDMLTDTYLDVIIMSEQCHTSILELEKINPPTLITHELIEQLYAQLDEYEMDKDQLCLILREKYYY